MAAKGDLLVNLCKRYVFGGWYQCRPMQYYELYTPISNPVEVSSTIIMYGKAGGGTYRQDKTTYAGT